MYQIDPTADPPSRKPFNLRSDDVEQSTLLASELATRNIRGTSLPYDVPLALAFLKVPMGALAAVVGILLLGGGFVPGLSELDRSARYSRTRCFSDVRNR